MVAVVRRYSLKNLFLKIPQKLQQNTCARVSFLIMLQYSQPLETLPSEYTSRGTVNPFVPNAPFLYPLKTLENFTVL